MRHPHIESKRGLVSILSQHSLCAQRMINPNGSFAVWRCCVLLIDLSFEVSVLLAGTTLPSIMQQDMHTVSSALQCYDAISKRTVCIACEDHRSSCLTSRFMASTMCRSVWCCGSQRFASSCCCYCNINCSMDCIRQTVAVWRKCFVMIVSHVTVMLCILIAFICFLDASRTS